MEWLGTFLCIGSAYHAHVIVTVDATSEGTRLRGDVSVNGELFLRFFGDSRNTENEEQE